MKKSLYVCGLAAIMMSIASCGNGNKSSESDDSIKEEVIVEEVSLEDPADKESSEDRMTESVEEEPAEDEGIYTPPFKVTVVHDRRNGVWEYHTTHVFNILKNGKLKGTSKYERRFAETNNPWELYGSIDEFSGKWSTSHISMGDGMQKVYVLDPSNVSCSYYLLGDCEYIWMCDDAWYYCENYDLNRAYKVTSVTKL